VTCMLAAVLKDTQICFWMDEVCVQHLDECIVGWLRLAAGCSSYRGPDVWSATAANATASGHMHRCIDHC
jgi:hypothetical protein